MTRTNAELGDKLLDPEYRNAVFLSNRASMTHRELEAEAGRKLSRAEAEARRVVIEPPPLYWAPAGMSWPG